MQPLIRTARLPNHCPRPIASLTHRHNPPPSILARTHAHTHARRSRIIRTLLQPTSVLLAFATLIGLYEQGIESHILPEGLYK